jgi:hypothetical protein
MYWRLMPVAALSSKWKISTPAIGQVRRILTVPDNAEALPAAFVPEDPQSVDCRSRRQQTVRLAVCTRLPGLRSAREWRAG